MELRAAALAACTGIFLAASPGVFAQAGAPKTDTGIAATAADSASASRDDATGSASLLGAKSDDERPQDQDTEPPAAKPRCDITEVGTCFHDVLHDQAGIWTSPFRLKPHDALWLVPLGAAIGVSMHYDPRTMRQVSADPHRVRVSTHISNAGAYGSAALLGVMYVIGKSSKNDTMRETGVLGLEAMADAAVVTEALKYALNRERPNDGTGTGRFWPHGTRDYPTGAGMPSLHATVTAAFSRVVIEETPGKIWIHLAAYALMAGVDVTRVTARQHFPSDVIVGSAIGYLVGGYVYHQHSEANSSSSARNFILAPIYDAPTHSYGMTAVFDPSAVRGWIQHLPLHRISE